MSAYLWIGLAGFGLTFLVLSAVGRDPYFHPDRRWILLISAVNGAQLATIAFAGVQAFRAAAPVGLPAALLGGLAAAAALGGFWLWVNVRTLL